MIHEDKYAENSMLNGDFDLAIPFKLSVVGENEPEITVFPSQLKVARQFIERFKTVEEMFSDDAISWVHEQLEPYMLEQLFGLLDSGRDHFIDYLINSVDPALILPETVRITGEEGYENLTGYDIETMNEYGHICFGTVIDGRIVSAACTNYPCDLSGEDYETVELGVETCGEYRNRGFALSNIAALAKFLLESGYEVLYECESKNVGSIAIIKRLGGVEFAKNFCVAAEKLSTEL